MYTNYPLSSFFYVATFYIAIIIITFPCHRQTELNRKTFDIINILINILISLFLSTTKLFCVYLSTFCLNNSGRVLPLLFIYLSMYLLMKNPLKWKLFSWGNHILFLNKVGFATKEKKKIRGLTPKLTVARAMTLEAPFSITPIRNYFLFKKKLSINSFLMPAGRMMRIEKEMKTKSVSLSNDTRHFHIKPAWIIQTTK